MENTKKVDSTQPRKQTTAWLARYQAAQRRQALLAEELAQLRAEAEHLTAALHGTPGAGSPDENRLPRAVERIAAAQEALENQIAACLQCRAEVVGAIGAIAHPQQQEVLCRRYLLGQTYAEIADAMGLVERRVYQLHRQGVEQVSVTEIQETDGVPAEDIQISV